MDVPAYKIASPELVDLPLIRKVAATKKPVIMSTGMATCEEIEEAMQAFCQAGGTELALLKCTSAYPSPPESMNLRTIPDMAKRFRVPVGLSDHTLGIAVPVAAVSLGACIIEKHFTLSRSTPGPDSAFSLEPHEFKQMVDAIRVAEKALGQVKYGLTEAEQLSQRSRRSLFVVQDVKAGERLTSDNVRSIRPGYGLPPKHYEEVIGRLAARDMQRGTPLQWDAIAT
jgi:N-acetylneuraminate synthase